MTDTVKRKIYLIANKKFKLKDLTLSEDEIVGEIIDSLQSPIPVQTNMVNATIGAVGGVVQALVYSKKSTDLLSIILEPADKIKDSKLDIKKFFEENRDKIKKQEVVPVITDFFTVETLHVQGLSNRLMSLLLEKLASHLESNLNSQDSKEESLNNMKQTA